VSVETGELLGFAPGDIDAVAHRIGEPVTQVRPTSWGWATPSASVRFASGAELVIQRRPAAEVERIATAIEVFRTAGIPVPRLLLRIAGGRGDLVGFGPVAGEVAAVRLGAPGGAAIARRMGASLVMIRAASPDGIPVDHAWTGPAALAEAAADWLDRAGAAPRLAAATGAATDVIRAVPWTLVTSHGDYVPVNAMFDGDALTAILDLADVALRHPLLDPAWWTLVVGHHHPDATEERRAFLAASGLRASGRELAAIAVLRSLQLAATARPPDRHAAHALLGSALLAWDGT